MRQFGQAALVSAICAVFLPSVAMSESLVKSPEVQIIFMGGNDCPYCRGWMANELPKLKQSTEFQAVQYTHVTKNIGASVPPAFFLPASVKALKDKLDEASSGRAGSPQFAIIVDGEVYDYFMIPRTAGEFDSMLGAIRTGGQYPFKRCLKLSKTWGKCEKEA